MAICLLFYLLKGIKNWSWKWILNAALPWYTKANQKSQHTKLIVFSSILVLVTLIQKIKVFNIVSLLFSLYSGIFSLILRNCNENTTSLMSVLCYPVIGNIIVTFWYPLGLVTFFILTQEAFPGDTCNFIQMCPQIYKENRDTID